MWLPWADTQARPYNLRHLHAPLEVDPVRDPLVGAEPAAARKDLGPKDKGSNGVDVLLLTGHACFFCLIKNGNLFIVLK